MPLASLDLDLEVFQGPFDLLLTLVLREEVDLLEVDLAEVVLAYVAHLEQTGELDLEAATEFLVVTECGLSDRLLVELPGKRFYKACKLCQYMKMITLEGTRDALRALAPEIVVPEEIRLRAARALERMLELSG